MADPPIDPELERELEPDDRAARGATTKVIRAAADVRQARPVRAVGALSAVQRGALGIAVGSFLILWPNLALDLAVAVAGVALALLGLVGTWRAIRNRQPARNIGRNVLDVVVGIGLFVVSSLSAELAVVAVAIALLVRGLLDGAAALRGLRSGGAVVWYAVRSFAQLAAAAAVAVIGSGVVLIVLLALGISWVVGGVVTIAVANVSRSGTLAGVAPPTGLDHAAAPSDATHEVVVSWFLNQDVGDKARQDVVEKLIFEGDDLLRRVARYASLMAFATAIAALGILTDSTAVVIGAMLVAPLMTPIMATSLSLVMGRPTRAIRSLGLVGAGVVIAVGFSFLIARYAPGVLEIGVNSQIASRTAPTLLDLLIALAAGFAGGYAVCRPDVSDSLPGVAIAVALVPPLAVVGITLSAGAFALSAGAFLLFLTNLVGIIVASGIIFTTTGVAPWADIASNAAQLRRASITVLAALVVVSIPLAITGRQILADATDHKAASSATEEWLDNLLGPQDDGSLDGGDPLLSLQLVQVGLDGDVVEVVLIGDGDLGDPQDLADRLGRELDRPIELELRVIPETRVSLTSMSS